MPLSLEAWRAAGHLFRYRGHEIFYRDEGTGPPLLLIHGFPTASWDWRSVWPSLAQRFRCIALDMMGFGFSAKPRDYRYSIADQASLQESLLRHLAIDRHLVMAHDYGDTVAQELLARDRGGGIRALCLLNGGLFPETHRPAFAQRMLAGPFGAVFARLVGPTTMRRNFRRIFGASTQPSDEELAGFWTLIESGHGRLVFPKLIGYMRERIDHRERWVGALADARVPLQVIVGMADPISGAHMAARCRELLPEARLVPLAGVGHYPHVESPAVVAEAALAFFADAPPNHPAGDDEHGEAGREAIDGGRCVGRPGPPAAHGRDAPRHSASRAPRRLPLRFLRGGRGVDEPDDDRYAREPEPGDVVRICRALNEAGARYLLIGGFAVIAHGAGRFTKDIDLLVDDAPDNVRRVKSALSVLADHAAAEVADDDVQNNVVVRIADEVVVDLMGRACGLDYAEAARDAEVFEREGVAIRIASPRTLIRTKQTPRPQDAIDRAFLEGVLRAREQGPA